VKGTGKTRRCTVIHVENKFVQALECELYSALFPRAVSWVHGKQDDPPTSRTDIELVERGDIRILKEISLKIHCVRTGRGWETLGFERAAGYR